MLLAYDEVLSSDADGIVLGEVTAKPLTLDDWFKYQKGEPLFVEIRGRVDVGSNTSKPGAPPVGTWICRSLQIDPAIKNESICLVDGGWLPLIYFLAGTSIFVDKNVVAEIKARFDGGYDQGRCGVGEGLSRSPGSAALQQLAQSPPLWT